MNLIKSINILLLSVIQVAIILLPANSQDHPETIERILENMTLQEQNDEIDYSSLLENLHEFLEHPLRINYADEENLGKLGLLNDFQVYSLMKYREKYGNFLTIYELQNVYGFDQQLAKTIAPFISFKTNPFPGKMSVKKFIKDGQNKIIVKTTPPLPGHEKEESYLGNDMKLLTHYRFHSYKKLYLGFTADKDGGEEFFKGSNSKGFDHYSGYIQLNEIGPFKKIMIGDYQAQFGQGLTLWSGFSLGNSLGGVNIKKYPRGFYKHSSSLENEFFRGLSTTVEIGKFDLSVFFSRKKIDGNLLENDSSSNSFSSFLTSGYHRTINEIADKDVIGETVTGAHGSFEYKNMRIGITSLYYTFDRTLKNDQKAYNQFSFSGNTNFNSGIDYMINFRKARIFGETAIDKNKSVGTLHGAGFDIAPGIFFQFLYRNFSKKYQALYSNAFSENSKISNEEGFFYGISINRITDTRLTAFFDYFKFPWLKYKISGPSDGYSYSGMIEYFPTPDLLLYLHYKNKRKLKDFFNEGKNIRSPTMRSSTRLHARFQVSEKFILRDRVEFIKYHFATEQEEGFLAYQDIIYMFNNDLNIYFRYCFFDTDGYFSRVYAYENDVPNAFSISAFKEQGIRLYLMIKYSPNSFLKTWIKFAFTRYTNDTPSHAGVTIQTNFTF